MTPHRRSIKAGSDGEMARRGQTSVNEAERVAATLGFSLRRCSRLGPLTLVGEALCGHQPTVSRSSTTRRRRLCGPRHHDRSTLARRNIARSPWSGRWGWCSSSLFRCRWSASPVWRCRCLRGSSASPQASSRAGRSPQSASPWTDRSSRPNSRSRGRRTSRVLSRLEAVKAPVASPTVDRKQRTLHPSGSRLSRRRRRNA